MGSCPFQVQIIGGDSVNQNPVGFDVTIPMGLPVSYQGMIHVLRLKFLFGNEQPDDLLQLVEILTLSFESFVILFEQRGVMDIQRSNSRNNSSTESTE